MENDVEREAIEILRGLCKSGCTIADSGGKDSSVLVHVAMKAGIPFKVRHNHTTVDAPETVYFVRDKFKKLREQGIDAEIFYPKETMWQLIAKRGAPPTRVIRYCCAVLKESCGMGEKMVTGVRRAEGNNRKNNQGIATIINPDKKIKSMVDGVNFQQTNKGGWCY